MERSGKTILHGKALVEFLSIFGGIEESDQPFDDKIKVLSHIPGADQIIVFFKSAFHELGNKIFPFEFRNGNLAFNRRLPESFEAFGAACMG